MTIIMKVQIRKWIIFLNHPLTVQLQRQKAEFVLDSKENTFLAFLEPKFLQSKSNGLKIRTKFYRRLQGSKEEKTECRKHP